VRWFVRSGYRLSQVRGGGGAEEGSEDGVSLGTANRVLVISLTDDDQQMA